MALADLSLWVGGWTLPHLPLHCSAAPSLKRWPSSLVHQSSWGAQDPDTAFPPVLSGNPEERCNCIWPSLDPFFLVSSWAFLPPFSLICFWVPHWPAFLGIYYWLLLGRCPGIIHTESSAQLTTGREPQIPVYTVMTACVLHPASSLCLASWLREGSDPGQQPWGTRPCPPQGWPDAGCCQVGPRGTGVSVEATLAPGQRLAVGAGLGVWAGQP